MGDGMCGSGSNRSNPMLLFFFLSLVYTHTHTAGPRARTPAGSACAQAAHLPDQSLESARGGLGLDGQGGLRTHFSLQPSPSPAAPARAGGPLRQRVRPAARGRQVRAQAAHLPDQSLESARGGLDLDGQGGL